MRAVDVVDSGPDVVLLASDGYGNAFADPDWHVPVGRDVHQQLREDGADAVRGRLRGWLSDAAGAAGDDATVGILFRVAS